MLAVMETDVSTGTGFASMSNVAVVAPSGTVTVGSTVTTLESDEVKFMTVPPTPAALSRVTVPTTPVPPLSLGCVTDILCTPALMMSVLAASTFVATSSAQ
jgi:hypothetical protein